MKCYYNLFSSVNGAGFFFVGANSFVISDIIRMNNSRPDPTPNIIARVNWIRALTHMTWA